ncbi:MAG: lysine--tRNA ligase, partial [Huintestinicola sp.]
MADEQLKANSSPAQEAEQTEEDIHILKKVRMEKLENLKAQGKNPFEITKFDYNIKNSEIRKQYAELEERLTAEANGDEEALKAALENNRINVKIAGRIMTWRNMGKANFIDVRDSTDRMQVYVRMNDIGEDAFKEFKTWDMGDIVGVEGFVFKTRTGEVTVHAQKITLLTKSLLPLPEKWHGLKDQDARYRQRYVDLIVNPDVADTFRKRSKIISSIRRYLDAQGFIEVETPMLVANAGGASARPFETHYNALNEDVKLRISLELYLKRLIVGGLDRVYEIGRVFRNEGVDTRHNPEFTLMELYQAYTDYYGMMDLTENMFRYLAAEVCGTTVIPYGEHRIDLGKPFERLTMIDAVKKYANVDFSTVKDTAEAKALAKAHNIEFEDRHERGDILNLFFEEYVEKHLIQPTFIMDHPVEISPLTKRKPTDPDYVERFELFINGWEMCN